MTQSDEQLIAAVAAGDREAFGALYRRRRADVYRFALHMTGVFYFISAAVLGGGYLFFASRLGEGHQTPFAAQSKKSARNLLRASVLYLPLLFLIMMMNAA